MVEKPISFKQLKQQLDYIQSCLQQAQQEREQILLLLNQILVYLQANPQPQPSRWVSEVGMDYSQLETYLAAEQWQEANEYTWLLLLALTGRTEQGWLNLEDIFSLPCTDLITLDHLWSEYSHGRFSFSLQQQVLEEVEGDYTAFCDRIGWRVQQRWLFYDQLNFSLQALPGHLPVMVWRKRSCYGVGIHAAGESLAALMTHLCQCYNNGEFATE